VEVACDCGYIVIRVRTQAFPLSEPENSLPFGDIVG
jgi:hypothetical protein